MDKKTKSEVLICMLLVVCCNSASAQARLPKKEPIYTAGPNEKSKPGGVAWTLAPNNVVTVKKGDVISIGVNNKADPGKMKRVGIDFYSTSEPPINVTSATGYDAAGNPIEGVQHRIHYLWNDYARFFWYYFEPQPAFEIFQVKNTGSANVTVTVRVRPAPKCYKEGFVPTLPKKMSFDEMYFYYPGTESTIEVDQIGIWHEEKTAEDGNFTPPPDSGTWDKNYITADPNTGELLPQGGVLWNCQPSDNGLWETEIFDLSLTTTSPARGNYWMIIHDRLRNEWVKDYMEIIGDIPPRPVTPGDGAAVPVTFDLLEWELPEPNDPVGGTVTCDVWFSDNYPNYGIDPNSPDFPDYATKIVDNEAVESVSLSSLIPPIELEVLKTYYWRIDIYDSSLPEPPVQPYIGTVLTFNTYNMAPVVDAGDADDAWLTDGTVDFDLLGELVADDGRPVAATLLWTVTGEPSTGAATIITDPTQPGITVRATQAGTYELTLTADDTDLTDSDTVSIAVYNDWCEAAKAHLTPHATDLNGDCITDILDLAIFAREWLLRIDE